MVLLYDGGGSSDRLEVFGDVYPPEQWRKLYNLSIRLLRSRGDSSAADRLAAVPFELRGGTNVFGDDFCVLHYSAPFTDYERLVSDESDTGARGNYRDVAGAVTEVTGRYVRFITVDLLAGEEGASPVPAPTPEISSSVVERALADAEHLLSGRGAPSAIDRIHTALHAYLLVVCRDGGVVAQPDAGITQLFKALREGHPAFADVGPRQDDTTKIVRGISSILDALNPVRNRASGAHPNEQVLDEPEAMLVINSVRTILHYIDARLRRYAASSLPALNVPASLPTLPPVPPPDDDIPF